MDSNPIRYPTKELTDQLTGFQKALTDAFANEIGRIEDVRLIKTEGIAMSRYYRQDDQVKAGIAAARKRKRKAQRQARKVNRR